jgi:four helix bundle protein
MGSATETECHLLVARDLGFISTEQCACLEAPLNAVKRMLHALLDRIALDAKLKT